MDTQTLNEFRAILEQRRAELTEAVRQHLLSSDYLAAPRSMDDGARDPADESVADLASDITLQRSVGEGLELAEVQRALDRMGRGEYGYCVDCGEEIPIERLRVQPTAVRDVRCQTLFEQANEKQTPNL